MISDGVATRFPTSITMPVPFHLNMVGTLEQFFNEAIIPIGNIASKNRSRQERLIGHLQRKKGPSAAPPIADNLCCWG